MRAYLEGDPDGTVEYFTSALTEMQPCGHSPKTKVAYTPQSRQLIVEYQLPATDFVPKAKSYRYVKSQDKVIESARPASQLKALYASAIAQLTLLCLARIFRADTKQHIGVVVFNGVVDTIDPRTGKPIRPCLITVRTTRDTFTDINLDQVDPVACLKHLNAGISTSPTELAPVRPVLEFSMVARSASKVNSRTVVGTPKSHQARSVAVPMSVLKILTPLMAGKSPDELMWCRADGQPRRPPTTTHWFGKAVKRCQANDPTFPRVSVHELRHTSVSLLIQSGAHVKTIQRQLGHKTATMTLDEYGHLMDDDLDTVADKMDDIVGGCAQNVPEGPTLSE